MRKLLLLCSLSLIAAPAFCDQGCIEYSTTTVATTVCSKFECSQRVDGNCVLWSCVNTQTNRYTDPSSGCTRSANCGKKALFDAGAPVEDPYSEFSETCDWYPCVQADPVTKACLSYLCVSKRIFNTVRITYPDALCVPVIAPPLIKKPEAQKQAKTQSPSLKDIQKIIPPPPPK